MRSHRPRRLALLAAAVLVGAPVLWGSVASAQTTDRVTFSGGCDSAAITSPERASVPAGTALELVNDLGDHAVLSLDGEPAVELPPNSAAGVVLHRGPVIAAMQVTCPAGELSASVTIDVTSRPAGRAAAPRVGDPADTLPSEVPGPGPGDQSTEGASPTPTSASGDGDQGDVGGAAVPRASGSGWGSGLEGVLAVIAAVCVVSVSVAAAWTVFTRKTVTTY